MKSHIHFIIRFSVGLILLLSFFAGLRADDSSRAQVIGDFVRIRQLPNLHGPIKSHVFRNMIVNVMEKSTHVDTVDGKEAHWFRVEANGVSGWVFGEFLDFSLKNQTLDTYNGDPHMDWFFARFPESTDEYENQLSRVTFTLPEYRSLITAVEKSSGVAANNAGLALYYTVYSKNKVRSGSDPLTAYLNIKLQSKEFLLKLIQMAAWPIQDHFPKFTDKKLLEDYDFVEILFQDYRFRVLLGVIPKGFFEDANRVLRIADHVSPCLQYCPARLVEDREFVKKMVEANPLNWFSVKSQFRDDEEIALLSMRRYDDGGGATTGFLHASDRLKNDRNFVAKALELGLLIKEIPSQFRKDQTLIKPALLKRPSQLEYASEIFKDDRPFLFELLEKRDYDTFCFASDRLRGDKELALKAVQGTPEVFKCASESLRDDKTVALAALSAGGFPPGIMKSLSPRLRDDEELVKALIDRCSKSNKGPCLSLASERLQEKLHELVPQ